MKRRSKTKTAMKKDRIRYRKEVMTKCGSCKSLFNGLCEVSNQPRHAVETSCVSYVAIVGDK